MDHRVKRCGCFIPNLDDQYYFIFRCTKPETNDYYYYFVDRQTRNNSRVCPHYFVDRQTRNNSRVCPHSKKFSCLQFKASFLG